MTVNAVIVNFPGNRGSLHHHHQYLFSIRRRGCNRLLAGSLQIWIVREE